MGLQIFNLSLDRLSEKIEVLALVVGLCEQTPAQKREEVGKMVLRFPGVLIASEQKIEGCLAYLSSCGFDYSAVIKLIKKFPQALFPNSRPSHISPRSFVFSVHGARMKECLAGGACRTADSGTKK